MQVIGIMWLIILQGEGYKLNCGLGASIYEVVRF